MTVERTGKPVYKLSYMQMSYMHSEDNEVLENKVN
jgi:hypothetical protein